MSIYSTLLRKTILPLLLGRENQGATLNHFSFFQKSQFWTRQQLLDYQWECLKKLLKESYENTVYYRAVMDQHGLTPDSFKSFDDIKLLPVLTRDITFEKQEQLFSNKYKRKSLYESLTGGTTGQQAILYRNLNTIIIKNAMAWRHESWMGRMPCDKMAHLWPATMDLDDSPPWKTVFKNRYLNRTTMYNGGALDKESLEYIHSDILRFKPSFMKAFPSALFGFTEFCLSHNLPLPKLKAIMSTGEPLFENQKQLFENAYQCQAFDMYGSREVGNTASECEKRDGLHIAMETSYVEFIKDNQSVEFGEEGEMYITDLTNFAFPLIRYAINDYGIPIKENCSCGRGLQLMGKAVGRLIENIICPDGSQILGHVLAIALTFEGPPIGQAQITQKSKTDFIVKITDNPKPTKEVFDYIDAEMKKFIGNEINVTIEVVKIIPKEKSGKFRFIKNEMNQS